MQAAYEHDGQLVSRILRAMLEDDQPHGLPASTLTKKASGEARQRLQEWPSGDFAHFLQETALAGVR